MIEVKSGGSLTIADAENQAAVSGACALGILRGLAGKRDLDVTSNVCLGSNLRTFSLTTEGPAHVLWAHREESNGSSMIWLGSYRITDKESALELVRQIAQILDWGATELKPWVATNIARLLTI